ncbi:MAG TPA: hypothetical protein VK563_03995 [Puia sp.]|nr:hypothetical protein [Puia sp.]
MLYYLNPGFMLVAFLASIALFFQRQTRYLKLFPYFLLLNVVAEAIEDYLAFHFKSNLFIINPFTVLTFCFYFFVLYQIINNPAVRRVIIWLLCLYPLAAFINIFFIQGMGVFHTVTYSIGCLLVAAICIFYFLELFQLPHSVNLMRQPAFWICSGLLFYFSCSFPIYGFNSYLEHHADKVTIRHLIILLTLLNVFLYSSFTIAFLCRLRTRKSM